MTTVPGGLRQRGARETKGTAVGTKEACPGGMGPERAANLLEYAELELRHAQFEHDGSIAAARRYALARLAMECAHAIALSLTLRGRAMGPVDATSREHQTQG